MGFRVSARTILHLGSELISSDGVAFYELVKNGLDAQADNIVIAVTYRLDYETFARIMRELGEDRDEPPHLRSSSIKTWDVVRDDALGALVAGAPDVEVLRDAILAAETHGEFVDALRDANQIEVRDNGTGMSRKLLEDVFLTVGTAHRAQQKVEAHETGKEQKRPILGEKGLGRLSVMRLGYKLEINTAVEGADRWNRLDIDWNDFADAADGDLEDVPVALSEGSLKDPDTHGTTIIISSVKSAWSREKLEQLAVLEFSRLADPLDPDFKRLPLEISFNGSQIQVPEFAKFLLEEAHGRLTARLEVDGKGAPRVTGLMEYRRHHRKRPLELTTLEMKTLTGIDPEVFLRLGPFDLELHWFNRRILTKLEGIGSLAVVRRILEEWAGGVAVYRDGYRVNPYGGKNDDWLDLDRDAFSTSGFKLNRGQIIARARITQRDNPYLVDQTNREGLKVNPEMNAFREILKAMTEIYRLYLVEIDSDIDRGKRVTAETALKRFNDEDERVAVLVPLLERALEGVTDGRSLTTQLRNTMKELRTAAEQVRAVAGAQESERGRVMHLASIGLLIESLAHELYRATAAGLDTIAAARRSGNAATTGTSLRVLDAQLRTLQKRLKVLDPLSTNARQTKEPFELVSWVEDVVRGFASRNAAKHIDIDLAVVPDGSTQKVRAVKGMFVQVLENLLSNSVYWVEAQHRERVRNGVVGADFEGTTGTIRVEIETARHRILITDDGPGVPEDRRDVVFEPFFTTKPQKQGKGLGLYISREIAEYHGGSLELGDADPDGQIRRFIFIYGDINE